MVPGARSDSLQQIMSSSPTLFMRRPLSLPDRILLGVFAALFLSQVALVALNGVGAPDSLDLARDTNVPALYSSVLLLGIGVTCLALYGLSTRWRYLAVRPVHLPRSWLVVATAFLYFSIDEAVMIHERVANNLFQAMGIWDNIVGGDITYALWEALYAPLFGGVCLVMLILLFRHRRAYPPSLWIGLAAIGSWGLALLMEFVGLTFYWQDQDLFKNFGRVEEAAELLGATLFLLAVVIVLRGALGWDRHSRPVPRPSADALLYEPP